MTVGGDTPHFDRICLNFERNIENFRQSNILQNNIKDGAVCLRCYLLIIKFVLASLTRAKSKVWRCLNTFFIQKDQKKNNFDTSSILPQPETKQIRVCIVGNIVECEKDRDRERLSIR